MHKNPAARAPYLDRTRFSGCWKAIGAAHDRAFDVLSARYSEAHRTYHNSEHIAECLAWLDRASYLAERPAELEIALFFHDAVYDPEAQDNEARSAELFRELAREAGLADESTRRIVGLIESTAGHAEETGDAALMRDIDLSILGASPKRYARFENDIRDEYSAFDDERYRAGRARVLRSFLDRIDIYRTPEFATRLETQARNNLSRALAALQHQL